MKTYMKSHTHQCINKHIHLQAYRCILTDLLTYIHTNTQMHKRTYIHTGIRSDVEDLEQVLAPLGTPPRRRRPQEVCARVFLSMWVGAHRIVRVSVRPCKPFQWRGGRGFCICGFVGLQVCECTGVWVCRYAGAGVFFACMRTRMQMNK